MPAPRRRWLWIAMAFGLLAALCRASAAESPARLDGLWLDPAGGMFTVKSRDGRIAWIGQGAKDGRFFLHKGLGRLEGNSIQGQWLDLPESQFYPRNGMVSGSMSADGATIRWQDSQGFYRQWVRQAVTAVAGQAPTVPTAPAGTAGGDGSGRNLLKNGDFEQGLAAPWGTGLYGDAVKIWRNNPNANVRAGISYRNFRSGKASFHILNASPRAPHVYGTMAQRIAIEPGRTYRISLWARGRDLASKGAVGIIVDATWALRPIALPAGSFEWTAFEGVFQLPEKYADIRIISEDRGEVWLDDIVVSPASID